MERFRVAENRIFDIGEHKFLFLVRENAIFEVHSGMNAILSRCSGQEYLSRDEFLDCIGETHEEGGRTFEGLVRRRVIETLGESETANERKAAGPASIPISTIVLHVTDGCNMECLYCYRSARGQREGKGKAMTPDVARRAVDFLFEHSGNMEKVVIVFFGGEPFLNFELMPSVVAYARERAQATVRKVDFAVTTNGTLLTEEAIRFIRENEIGVTVSIDGFEDAHDRHRRLADGSPSYNMIMPKVQALLQAIRERPVVARVTVAGGSSDDVPGILEHLLAAGFAEVGFAPVTTRDLSYQLDGESMRRLLGQFKMLSERFLNAAMRDEFFGFSNLIDLLVALHEGEVKTYPCGAGLGLFSVDTDGRIYLCQRLTGEDHVCMGDISEGIAEGRVREFRERAELSRRETCKSCWARAVCAGGCYHEALVREGNLTAPNLHYCEWIKSWVEMGLSIYGQIALSRPEYLDKLSMLRGYESARAL